jgi:adenosylcobinamide-GDP ribazoletransferase
MAVAALLIVPLIGRSALLAVFLTTPYVRELVVWGRRWPITVPRKSGWWVLGLQRAGLRSWWPVMSGVVGAGAWRSLGFAWLRRVMMRRLGGTTGDTAGALLELLEVLVLVGLALI